MSNPERAAVRHRLAAVLSELQGRLVQARPDLEPDAAEFLARAALAALLVTTVAAPPLAAQEAGATGELVVTDDGNEWHLIGFEPDGRNDMTIRCTPTDKRSDNATYAYSTVDGFTARANTGNGLAIVGTFADKDRSRYAHRGATGPSPDRLLPA